ncbi:MAG: sulfite exporter TauE/SafE family protein [Zetaproteobacteria bacterium]|nr:sulfite exporter TauE/SafE family protein [Zetaproteobacteria bacterium]
MEDDDIETSSGSSLLPVALAVLAIVLGGAGLYFGMTANQRINPLADTMDAGSGIAARLEKDIAAFETRIAELRAKSAELEQALSRTVEVGAGVGVGGVAGFLGGLLGVGGGNFILPVLNWLGLDPKVAAGTTALVVVFSSFSGFLGHATLGGVDPLFIGVTAVMAAAGSIVGSQLMKTKLSSSQLKKMIGVLLWLIAAKMIFDLVK